MIVFSVLGFGFLLQAIYDFFVAQKVNDTPKSKAASAPQGLVEVEGFAWPKDRTVRNTKDQEAVFLQLALEKEVSQGSGKNRRTVWRVVQSKHHAPVFFLVDPTGVIEVDPSASQLNLKKQVVRNWQSFSQDEKARMIDMHFSEPIHGFPPSNFLGGMLAEKFRVVEREILVGSPLFANGNFQTENSENQKIRAPGLTGFFNKVINADSRSFKNLNQLFDQNRNGDLSENELHEGFVQNASVARKQANGSIESEHDFSVFGRMTNSEDHTLILADTHEKQLLERASKRTWMQLSAAAVFFAISLSIQYDLIHFEKFLQKTVITLHRSAEPAKRRQQASNPSETSKPSITALHYQCVSGQVSACKNLLSPAVRTGLQEQNIRYYEFVACKSGVTSFCNSEIIKGTRSSSSSPTQ